MSITFSPVTFDSDITAFEATCFASGSEVTVVSEATYDAAIIAATAHTMACDDCAHYRCYVTPVVAGMPEGVNMSNHNAAYVIGLLGLEFDYSGTIAAATLAERVEFAKVVGGGDAGTADVTYNLPGGATMVDCGRHAGYADERLAQLAEVAAWALAHGRDVQWS